MTDARHDDVPRSPTGRVPQWVLDEATGKPSAPTLWRAAPSTYQGQPPVPRLRRWRGRNTVTTLVVAALLVGVVGWTATGHNLLPTPKAPTAAAAGSATARPSPTVTAPRDAPPAGLGEQAAPLGQPPSSSRTSTSFRFIAHQPQSTEPVAFSPCRPIHYVVRADHTPPGGGALITRSVLAVSQATGLRFVYDGHSTDPIVEGRDSYQPARYGDRWAPVLIAWATADEVPDFGVDILGEAGPQEARRQDGTSVFVTGQVYLDAAKATLQVRGRAGATLVQAVVEHELGHLVGLAHVNDTSQLMYPRASGSVVSYGPGDLAGLAELGRGACAPDV